MMDEHKWAEVWDRLADWVTNYPIAECPDCGHRDHSEPTWEQQVAKIEELVEAS